LVGIPERTKPFERPKHGWNTKMGLKSRVGWHGLDSSGSRYEQMAGLVNMTMTELIKCREFLEKTSSCVS
jgi:hypothetical protein